MSRPTPLLTGLLIAALLGTAAAAYYRAQVRQAATLAQLSALDTRLAASNAQRLRSATRIINGIKRSVCLSNNQPDDLLVLREAERIQSRTQALADTLHKLRQQVQLTKLPAEQVALLTVQLSRYFAFIGTFSELKQPVAKLAAAYTPSQWQGSPAAASAALTYTELLLRRAETLALEQQGIRAGSNYDGFDVVRPLAVSAATTIAPGAEYQAQLLLAWQGRSTTCSMQPIAEVNGVSISALAGQPLPVSFRIPTPRAGQPDTLRTQWRGLVRLQGYLTDTTLNVAVPYLIVKRPAL